MTTRLYIDGAISRHFSEKGKIDMEKAQIRRSYSIAGFMVLIVVAIQMVITSLPLALFPDANPFMLVLFPLILCYVIVLPILWLIVKKSEKPELMPEKHRIPPGKLAVWFLAFFGVSRLIMMITILIQGAILGEGYMDPVTTLQLESPEMMFFTVAFVAPVAEELIYRGLLYRLLAPYGGKFFILVSSLLFALFHMNITQIPFAFVLGLFFGYIMYRTGNVLIPMLMHFITNLISGVGMLFMGSETGMQVVSFGVFGIVIVGMVFFIVLIAKKRVKQDIVFEPATLASAEAREAFVNPGIMLSAIVMIILTAVGLANMLS